MWRIFGDPTTKLSCEDFIVCIEFKDNNFLSSELAPKNAKSQFAMNEYFNDKYFEETVDFSIELKGLTLIESIGLNAVLRHPQR